MHKNETYQDLYFNELIFIIIFVIIYNVIYMNIFREKQILSYLLDEFKKNPNFSFDPEYIFPKTYPEINPENIDTINKLLDKFNNDYVFIRYYILGWISNISLSVDPDVKIKWKIKHELFGNPYNTHGKYSSLFPDENSRAVSSAYQYKPEKNDVILANPPYTFEHISKTIKMIIDWTKKYKFKIYLIIPVWDFNGRKELNLKLTSDFPLITKLKNNKYTKRYKIYTKFKFYDGFTKQKVYLKTPIYVFLIDTI